MGEVEKMLLAHGVKPTAQRVVIAEYVLHTHSHPTADEILQAVADRLPVLSRATVYNTLHTLVEAGVIQEVVTDAGSVRYDANTSDHHHFVDVKSGKIFDIPKEFVPELKEKLGDQYKVHGYKVVFYGEIQGLADAAEDQ